MCEATDNKAGEASFNRGEFSRGGSRGGFSRGASSSSAPQHPDASHFSNRGRFARGGSSGNSVSFGSRGGFFNAPEVDNRELTTNETDEQIPFYIPSPKCEQVFEAVEKIGKFGVVLTYLRQTFFNAENDTKKFPRTIIFCDQGTSCEKLVFGLELSGISAIPLGGIRDRDLLEEGFKAFRQNDVSIICVTNPGYRRIDIKDIDLIVNYDMPRDFLTYVFRIARNRPGKCISFISLENDLPLLFEIKKSMEKGEQTVPQSLVNVVGDFDPAQLLGFGLNTFENAHASVEVEEGVDVKGEKPQASIIDSTGKNEEDNPGNEIQEINPSSVPAEKKDEIGEVKNDEAEKLNVAPSENEDVAVKNDDEKKQDVDPVPTPIEHEEEKKPADEDKPPAEEGTAKTMGNDNKDESKPKDVAAGGNDEAEKLNVAPAENEDVAVKNDDEVKHDVDLVPTLAEHGEEKKSVAEVNSNEEKEEAGMPPVFVMPESDESC